MTKNYRSPALALALAAAISLIVAPAIAQDDERDHSKECTVETCKAGTRALTYFREVDPYYICPTRELATYVSVLVGLLAAQVALSGSMPNISDQTGEPEYTGETKSIVDGLRAKAHVETFDQAVAMCAQGSDKRTVTVLNMPAGATSIVAYVEDDRLKRAFWMPFAYLDKLSDH
jgi:hypothetical protein